MRCSRAHDGSAPACTPRPLGRWEAAGAASGLEIAFGAVRCPTRLLGPLSGDDQKTLETLSTPAPRWKSTLSEGEVAGPFHIERLLATGGFSEVYRARRLGEETAIALKVLHANLVDNRDATLRLMREADASWSISHPNVVRVYDVGMLPDERPYLSMELLEGESLYDHLQRQRRLSVEDTLAILEPLCDALGVLHRLGIVHRDLKPSNVFLDQRDGDCRVVLLDFGIAKFLGTQSIELTETRHLLGTPGRMAPEQILGRPVDARTDVYALGALAFHLLAGERPFGDRSHETLRQLHLHAKRPRVSEHCNISPGLDAVLVRAMAIDPVHRYPSPGELLEAFRAHARSPTLPPTSKPERGRHRETVTLLVYLHVAGQALDHGDDALLDDIDAVIDIAVSELRTLGFLPALESGTKLLYVRPIEPGGNAIARAQACERALSDARGVYRAMARRATPDPRVTVILRLHLETEQREQAVIDAGVWAGGTPPAGVSMTLPFTNALGTPQG
jgi:serine/threonine protein kinase